MNKIYLPIAAIGFMLAAQEGRIAQPDVPDVIKAPKGEEVVLMGHATGVQIYVCQAGVDKKFAWVLRAPEAELTDTAGKKIIHHFVGPTWQHVDGSEVTGKKVAQADAPKPDAIPWLLLTATSHAGEGILSRVTSIQRIHTEGALRQTQIHARHPRTAKSRGARIQPITFSIDLRAERIRRYTTPARSPDTSMAPSGQPWLSSLRVTR